jgi:hypothetical protein
MWNRHGKRVYGEDPTYFLVIRLGDEQVKVLSQEPPHLPDMIEGLLFDSLNTENMSYI